MDIIHGRNKKISGQTDRTAQGPEDLDSTLKEGAWRRDTSVGSFGVAYFDAPLREHLIRAFDMGGPAGDSQFISGPPIVEAIEKSKLPDTKPIRRYLDLPGDPSELFEGVSGRFLRGDL